MIWILLAIDARIWLAIGLIIFLFLTTWFIETDDIIEKRNKQNVKY